MCSKLEAARSLFTDGCGLTLRGCLVAAHTLPPSVTVSKKKPQYSMARALPSKACCIEVGFDG